ncbi:hypothetical protein C0Q70_01036 [Pomacea canaliculata]|uniref:EGF-like domain-containing protein n=1 Tax=Pomacea canaliculata TaxID=400727 RepID=A0A2T7PYC1_POMCA|nr:hypothetical protein C0Q70_01036 [Pomacea canaliculata]
MPSATDNSGARAPLITRSHLPPAFRLDMQLSESQRQLQRLNTVSPDLTCPDYLQFNVSSNTSYTVDLQTAGNITGANLTFHPDRMVQVGPTTVGVAPYHVTTTDKYGFERQCAFMVDIRPTECLSDYLTPGGATMQCTSQEGEGLNCTVTCDAGMAFQDGSTTETYSCSEQNVWSPTLPARSCSPTVVPRYIYMVAINYTWDGTGSISSCLNQSAGELVAVIPTRTVTPCSIDGGPPYITFNASVFSLDNNATNLVLELTVANLTSISSSDLEYCRSIFSTPFSLRANDFFKIQSTNCTEETGSVTFTPDSRNVTRNGYVCPRGTTLQLVNAQQLCVQCEPGYMENEGQCIECPSGQYQNETGQTECKTCAGSFSSSPRVSASQCVACPPGQYPVNSTSCSPCPRGYYKTLTSYYKCTECPDDTTTSSTGSSASTDCIPLTSPACENGGTPIIYFHEFTCTCPEGYYGTTCENWIDPCAPNPCYNYGSCIRQGINYTCWCPPGFTGNQCQVDSQNNCQNNTCSDIRFCRDKINSADCVCPSVGNYTGPQCAVPQDLCSSSPCKNGATCQNFPGVRYTCKCQPGYTGSTCETLIDQCALNSHGCLYGGQCTNGINNYTCSCQQSYQGSHCQQTPDYCNLSNPCLGGVCYNDYNMSKALCACSYPYRLNVNSGRCEEIDVCSERRPCQNNATCQRVSPGQFHCACPQGYEGSLCQHIVRSCTNSSCVHGQCVDVLNNYTCVCDAGYTGRSCEVDVNDCPGQCVANNTLMCIDGVNQYTCSCKAGFTGVHCETNINECASLPCKHNGACVESVTPGDYNCTCRDGWTGKNCDTLPVFCRNDSCQNGGVCYNLQDRLFCSCQAGTHGNACNETTNICSIVSPCVNPNQCQSRNETASCNCPQNYTGGSCQLVKDFCSPNPCPTGQCVTTDVGYSCQCQAADNCTTTDHSCASLTCPSGSSCVETASGPLCLCHPGYLLGGGVCKNTSSDFDIYFTRRSNTAVRALQPFTVTGQALSLTFWISFLDNSSSFPVQLISDRMDRVLLVSQYGVTFGGTFAVNFTDYNGSPQSLPAEQKWTFCAITWSVTGHYKIYIDSVELPSGSGIPNGYFPSLGSLLYPYIGEDFAGYISQLNVWNGTLTSQAALALYANSDAAPSSLAPAYRWAEYQFNSCVKLISPSTVKRDKAMCQMRNYGNECANDTGEGHVCNSGEADSGDSTLTSCAAQPSLGESVTCPVNSSVMPFTPKVLTCGKLGSYNLGDLYTLPPAQPCSDFVDAQVLATLSLKYQLSISCGTSVAASMKSNLQNKVKTLAGTWQKLCNNSNCDSVNVNVVCNSNTATASLIFHDLPAQLTSGNVTYTVTELLKVSAIEQDTFVISFVANSVLIRDEVTVTIQMTCRQGYGRFGAGCVQCVAGSFLNSATNMCEQCAVGTYTNSPGQTQCTPCPQNQTTLRVGSTSCVEKCSEGGYYNLTNNACQPCFKNFYQPNKGSVACFPCPPNSFTAGPGTVSLDKCRGEYLPVPLVTCVTPPLTSVNCVLTAITSLNSGKTRVSHVTSTTPPTTPEAPAPATVYLCVQRVQRTLVTTPVNLAREDRTAPTRYKTDSSGALHVTPASPPSPPALHHLATVTSLPVLQVTCVTPALTSVYSVTIASISLAGGRTCVSPVTPATPPTTPAAPTPVTANSCVHPVNEDLGNQTCQPCQQGYFRSNSLADRFRRCTACNAAFTTAGFGSTSSDNCNITACSPGYMRIAITNQCVLCPYGYYQPLKWQDECISCNTSYTTNNTGSTSTSDCIFVCPAGSEDLGNHTCQPCPRGSYRANSLQDRFLRCTACNTSFTTLPVLQVTCVTPALTSVYSVTIASISLAGGRTCVSPVTPATPPTTPAAPTPVTANLCVQRGQRTLVTTPVNLAPEDRTAPTRYKTDFSGAPHVTPASPPSPPALHLLTTVTSLPVFQVTCVTPALTSVYSVTIASISLAGGRTCVSPVTPATPPTTPAAPTPVTANPGYEVQTPGVATCSPCSRGKYKTNNGDDKFRACQTCSSGMTTDGTAAWSASFCNIALCKAGQVIMNGSPLLLHQVYRLSIWYWDQTDGETSLAACLPMCGPGQQYNSTVSQCVACPQGTWNSGNASQQFDPCAPCPATYVTVGEGATSADNCTLKDCPPGQYIATNDSCKPCPLATYQSARRQYNCTACPAGTNTSRESTTDVRDCTAYCQKGFRLNSAGKSCDPCEVGFYKDQRGNSFCIRCPANSTTTDVASTSINQCIANCTEGQHRVPGGCKDCPIGTYQPEKSQDSYDCADGTAYSTLAKVCEKCVIGYYRKKNDTADNLLQFVAIINTTMTEQCNPGQRIDGTSCGML